MGIMLLGKASNPNLSDPREPDPLYSLGPKDYSHRWAAERVVGNVGDTITRWPDLVGSDDLRTPSGGTGFILGTNTSQRVLRMTSVSSSMVSTTSAPLGKPGTIAVAVLIDAASSGSGNRYAGRAFGIRFYRAGNKLVGVTGSGGFITVAGTASGWAVMIVAVSGASPLTGAGDLVVNANGTEVITPSAPITPSSSFTPFGLDSIQTSPAVENQYAEAVVWDRMLTASERGQVLGAMQEHYAFL
ncbi:hypothetical protein [Curtobacterium sp. MCSS17_015]|uniref:hypothetical protein n=1 Tax=Curtobacterium sp. MCSS17_015 TaxID=2175666 RepID=UPI000DA88CF7|nr:hypothetical protein [Curtobacterium sp. MCSS17_015]WIB25437.1 hypothetical protein DEJ18_10245 [Curtobacterium sp. MCSS17_015]